MTQEEANRKLEEIQEKYFSNANQITKYIAVVNVNDYHPISDGYYIEIGIKGKDLLIIVETIMKGRKSIDYSKHLFLKEFKDDFLKGDQVVVYSDDIEYQGKEDDFINKKRYDNLVGGISISNTHNTFISGTAGVFFKFEAKGDTYMITNRHVLKGTGVNVSQPSICDSQSLILNPELNPIGNTVWRSNDKDNYIDAAIVKITYPDVDFVKKSCCKGVIYKGLKEARVGMCVRKCGRTTGLTYGVVRSINCMVNVSNKKGKIKIYKKQILTNDMSNKGDSGSVLVDDTNHIIGLLFAGNKEKQNSYYNNIYRVFKNYSKENKYNNPIF